MYKRTVLKSRLETTPLSLGKETGQVTINVLNFAEVVQGKGCGHQCCGLVYFG